MVQNFTLWRVTPAVDAVGVLAAIFSDLPEHLGDMQAREDGPVPGRSQQGHLSPSADETDVRSDFMDEVKWRTQRGGSA